MISFDLCKRQCSVITNYIYTEQVNNPNDKFLRTTSCGLGALKVSAFPSFMFMPRWMSRAPLFLDCHWRVHLVLVAWYYNNTKNLNVLLPSKSSFCKLFQLYHIQFWSQHVFVITISSVSCFISFLSLPFHNLLSKFHYLTLAMLFKGNYDWNSKCLYR